MANIWNGNRLNLLKGVRFRHYRVISSYSSGILIYDIRCSSCSGINECDVCICYRFQDINLRLDPCHILLILPHPFVLNLHLRQHNRVLIRIW